MTRPLMPKATAVWLVENSVLTFQQIAEFSGLHMLEIQAIADGEVAVGMQGLDPIRSGEVDGDLLKKCEADPDARLEITKAAADHAKQQRKKKGRYTPVSKRQDRPDAIAWLLKNYPELTDAQIGKLVGTTKPTINAVRERTHWNTPNITAQNPVSLGLCNSADLEKVISVARARAGTVAASSAPVEAENETGAEVEAAVAPEAEILEPAIDEPVSTPPAGPFDALSGMASDMSEPGETSE
jgi:uncharacterized protein